MNVPGWYRSVKLQRVYKWRYEQSEAHCHSYKTSAWSVFRAKWIQATSAPFREDFFIAHLFSFLFPTLLSTLPSFLKTKTRLWNYLVHWACLRQLQFLVTLRASKFFNQFMGCCRGKVILQDKSLQLIRTSGREDNAILDYNAFVKIRRKN